jgi:hypothetical protein
MQEDESSRAWDLHLIGETNSSIELLIVRQAGEHVSPT